MEQVDHCPLESSSSYSKPEDLLEECWFFKNSLDRKAKKAILRCYSDPCPSSSSYSQEMLAGNSSGGTNSSSMTKFSSGGGCDPPPLLPRPCVAAGEEVREEKAMSESILGSSRHDLLRTPSLPPCIGREEDAESDFALSKLIRQASLNSPDVLPPRRNSKVKKQSSSTPQHRPRKNPELESIEKEACNGMRRLSLDQDKITRKSARDLEFKEVKRFNSFKDMGFKFDKRDSNPSEDKSSGPPIPSWVDSKNSSAEDMKAQIKFWARAVAANVR